MKTVYYVIMDLKDNTQSPSYSEVDVWLIRDNLALTYEERVVRHQDTLDCIEFLKKIRQDNHAKFAKASPISRSNDLIKSKQALGRHRDLIVVEELKAVLCERKE